MTLDPTTAKADIDTLVAKAATDQAAAVAAQQAADAASQAAAVAAQKVTDVASQTAAVAAQKAADQAALTAAVAAQKATDAAALAAAVAAQKASDQAVIDQLNAKIALLESELNPDRFPGDPGAGNIVVGAIVSGGAGSADQFETANGVKLGSHRTYFSKGIADLAPGGPVRAYITREHAAGRLPMVSVKLDWAQTIAGTYDAQIADFATWVESLAKVVDLIVNHEPENDGQPAADFCGEQRHVRKVIGRNLRRLSFGGSLMAYDWTTASGRTPDDWFPGNADDGKPTWDWCGLDQYAQTSGNPIEDAKFKAALVSLAKWGVTPAFTELGIRVSDPTGNAKLAQLYEDVVGLGFVKFVYYDSDVNSTSVGWVLSGALLAEFVALCKDTRSVHPAA